MSTDPQQTQSQQRKNETAQLASVSDMNATATTDFSIQNATAASPESGNKPTRNGLDSTTALIFALCDAMGCTPDQLTKKIQPTEKHLCIDNLNPAYMGALRAAIKEYLNAHKAERIDTRQYGKNHSIYLNKPTLKAIKFEINSLPMPYEKAKLPLQHLKDLLTGDGKNTFFMYLSHPEPIIETETTQEKIGGGEENETIAETQREVFAKRVGRVFPGIHADIEMQIEQVIERLHDVQRLPGRRTPLNNLITQTDHLAFLLTIERESLKKQNQYIARVGKQGRYDEFPDNKVVEKWVDKTLEALQETAIIADVEAYNRKHATGQSR